MRTRVGLMLALVGVLASCRTPTNPMLTPEPEPGPVDLAPPPVLDELRVAADNPLGVELPQGPMVFKLLKLRELYFRLQTQTPPGNGVTWLSLSVYDPTSGLFHSRHVPFSLDGTPATIDSPDGIPHPIPVEKIKQIPGGYAYDQTLIVGGTNMTRYPRPGLWKATAALDNQPSVKGEVIIELGMFQ